MRYIITSIIGHLLILLAFIIGFDVASSIPVIENTSQHEAMSAVILGDTSKSKILPQKILPKIIKQETEVKVEKITEKTITIEKKKVAETPKKILFAENLLADIKKERDQHNNKNKKIKTQKVKSAFEKTLQQQAEKSLRQQLLNEEIKLQGSEQHLSQGEVNKYKALIVQSISEHWMIPSDANKSLYCELMIRLGADGEVLQVTITKTSGDPSLDSSARAAVLKSSPLPVPTDPAHFSAFRQFVLRVKPENVLAQDE